MMLCKKSYSTLFTTTHGGKIIYERFIVSLHFGELNAATVTAKPTLMLQYPYNNAHEKKIALDLAKQQAKTLSEEEEERYSVIHCNHTKAYFLQEFGGGGSCWHWPQEHIIEYKNGKVYEHEGNERSYLY